MKLFYTLFIFILLFTEKNFSQQPVSIIHITKLPEEGILLDKGWKFLAGDNAVYAQPDYDDTKWQSINPTLDVRDSLPQIQKSGICWFRLHLLLDSNLVKHQLALLVLQSGASEIYVNGKQIRQFGVVSPDPEKIESYNPYGKPIPFPVENNPEIVLSIRYRLEPDFRYFNIYTFTVPALNVRVNMLETSVDQYARESARQMNSTVFRIGLFLMLVILHFAFYLFYPLQKANLYFSLFALCVVSLEIINVNTVNGINVATNIHSAYYAVIIGTDLSSLSNFLLLTAFYTLFGENKGIIYWALLCIVVLYILASAYYRWSWVKEFVFSILFYAEIIRIAFKSVKNKKRGARIIATGAILFLIFWIAFILGVPFNYIYDRISLTYSIGDLTYNLMYISIPIATSIYLGLDFAFTSFSLKQKLSEVEYLSSKTIEQEKEKQQILASQNETLESQVAQRTSELQHSLKELKATQAQLIQSEKMASLGELTAGIAHEIQNPLNFVNNFSEVNKEILEELKAERLKPKGERNEQTENEIINDVIANEEKINHHGKRADAIVKGMLQHSQTSTGQKELTDINKLADEYLRLSYQGQRSKDKSFNATLQTDFDETIGKINIIPQDIGRVLLNLYNNAFYAVAEKKKLVGDSYEPTVSVSTKKDGDKVLVSVKDNGNGIPQKIVDKIFQPFFTTKPTGQGTGLGLSLAYDIIKAHGGEIKVETKEGEGSEFIIQLIL